MRKCYEESKAIKTRGRKDVFSIHQQDELNSEVLYEQIAQKVKNDKERKTLTSIAKNEQKHAVAFEKYSYRKLKPNYFRINLFLLVHCLLGYTFLIKLLEYGESMGIHFYQSEIDQIPELRQIVADE